MCKQFMRGVEALIRAPGATIALLFLVAACGDSTGPDGGVATLSGTVRAAGSSATLAGAEISIGALEAVSDANGRFEVTSVPIGAATVRAERPGYLPADAAITITAGANSHDFTLTPQEVYTFGTSAAYVPAGVTSMRAAIILLGGPETSGFVTGERLTRLEQPAEFEQSLQELGASLRALATSARVALIGSKIDGMENSAANDAALLAALGTAAQLSGHPELQDAPVLMVGISHGALEAVGLASRHPERTIGLLVRSPFFTSLTQSEALGVPAFVMQAENDAAVDNQAVVAIFAENRARGGLWALAVEPEIGHFVATSVGNSVMKSWIANVLARRLPATPGGALVVLDETSGWLGNQTTLEVAPWGSYPDDPDEASWLLSESAATGWRRLSGAVSPGG